MNPALDHERCSELLLDFVEGTAGDEDRALVEAHLATCKRCAAEHTALTELVAPVAPLTAAESEALRIAMARELRPSASETVVPLRSPRSGIQRYARWVAAAALILGGVVFGRALFLGEDAVFRGAAEGEAGGGGGVGAPAEDAADTADVSDRLLFRRPRHRPEAAALGAQEAPADANDSDQRGADQQRKRGTTRGGAGTATSSGYAGPPRPLYVRGAGTLSEHKLTLIGRYGLPLVLFPRAYSAADANRSKDVFLAQLANVAENDARAEQIVDCGAQVLGRDTPTLPALATFGRYQDTEVLVLAFAWSPKPDGRLNRYMVWTWPAGDCNAVPSYRAGTIGV